MSADSGEGSASDSDSSHSDGEKEEDEEKEEEEEDGEDGTHSFKHFCAFRSVKLFLIYECGISLSDSHSVIGVH